MSKIIETDIVIIGAGPVGLLQFLKLVSWVWIVI
tara:strand:- start:425 stop:526 length:102 start_codon:yes stop_codon:yes gene_type:complete